MATKKKTKVGSLLSKVGSAIKGAVSTVKKVVSSVPKTSQTGSASSAIYSALKTPSTTKPSTTLKTDTVGTQYVRNPQPTVGPVKTTTKIDTVGTQYVRNPSKTKGPYDGTSTTKGPVADATQYDDMLNNIASTFGGATAPTNISSIAPSMGTGTFGGTSRIPTIPYETPDISPQKAELEASKKYNDLRLKEEQQQELTEQDKLAQENKGILERILGTQEKVQDVRRDYEKYYQVSAQQAKIESLTKDYNSLVAQRDQQIAEITHSPYGTMDFTNNRINAIYDMASARINELSANIKFETAQLTQKQELVNQAVNDFYKDEDRKLNLFQMYMDQNSEIISRLDKKEQTAIQQAFELKKMQLDEARDIRMMVAQAGFENPSAGINPWTDTPEQAMKKLASVPGGGTGGLTPAQINATVNQIAGSFDNEQIVKNYNTAQEGYQTIKSIGANTKSPADDIAFIYAFAKIMDPNSVVREGEYNTIQKYAQTWADNFGFTAKRIFSNTNFLSADAKQKMLNALSPKINTISKQYENLASEYQRQINAAYSGQPRQITNYSQAFEQPATQEQSKLDIFDSVVSQDSGGYFKNLWNAIFGK